MTLGERLIELSDHGFQIKFEKLGSIIGLDSKNVIVMRITRGTCRRYFTFDPYEFHFVVSPSDVDNFLLEILNKSVREIIDKENEELRARKNEDTSDNNTD